MIEIRLLTHDTNSIIPVFKTEKYRRISETAINDILTNKRHISTSTYVDENGRFCHKGDSPIYIAHIRSANRFQIEKGCYFEVDDTGESYD